jgi:2-keto-3-deoxy-6-phosphogluconate aldolase
VTLELAPTPLVAILRGVTPDEADSIAAVIVEAGFRRHRGAAQFTRSLGEH